MKPYLPPWTHEWFGAIAVLLHVGLILAGAWLLRSLAGRLIERLRRKHDLPAEVTVGARRLSAFLIYAGALLLILERLGVSGAVLWTAFTGFAAVAAIAFFAAWSVLSNIFCALLLLITRPFRLHDHIELVESGDKPGLGGRVIDMNLIHVTVEETWPEGGHSVLRLPNSLFFQRATRRWHGLPVKLPVTESSSGRSAPATAGGGAAADRDGP